MTYFDAGFLWKFGGTVNIQELAKEDGLTRQYTHKAKGDVYTVVTVAKAVGDIRNGGFGPIIVYKNESGDLFSCSLKNFEDFMNPIDGPFDVTFMGPGVWAGIPDELPPELVGKQVYVSTVPQPVEPSPKFGEEE